MGTQVEEIEVDLADPAPKSQSCHGMPALMQDGISQRYPQGDQQRGTGKT